MVALFSALASLASLAVAADADLYSVSGASLNGSGTPQAEAIVDAAVGFSGGITTSTASDLAQVWRDNGLADPMIRQATRLDVGLGWTWRSNVRTTLMMGGYTRVDAPVADFTGGGVSDIRLQSTINAPEMGVPVMFAIVPQVSGPLGDLGHLMHGGWSGTLTGVAQWTHERLTLLGNVGATVRPRERLADEAIGSTLNLLMAGVWQLAPGVRVGSEFVQTLRLTPAPHSGNVHLFADAGLTPDWTLRVATGGGQATKTGQSPFRMVLGLTYGRAQNDQDGDGIVDTMDACPIDAEDFDGLADEDGCPEADADWDGVLDAADLCPLEPEDHDGYASVDGCPDIDNDEDGVLDTDDQCPDNAGHSSSAGCDGAMFSSSGEFVLARPITFDDEHHVTEASPLAAIATLLAKDSTYRVLVRVHTDNRPDDDTALARSQAQASFLTSAFLALGVSASQVEFEGVGSRYPIDTNRTSTGRSSNNRVEIVRRP